MGVRQNPYPEFARALGAGHTDNARMLALELPRLGLNEALRLAILFRRDADQRAETWLARWVARYAIDTRGLTLSQLSERVDTLLAHGEPRTATTSPTSSSNTANESSPPASVASTKTPADDTATTTAHRHRATDADPSRASAHPAGQRSCVLCRVAAMRRLLALALPLLLLPTAGVATAARTGTRTRRTHRRRVLGFLQPSRRSTRSEHPRRRRRRHLLRIAALPLRDVDNANHAADPDAPRAGCPGGARSADADAADACSTHANTHSDSPGRGGPRSYARRRRAVHEIVTRGARADL